MPGLLTEGNTAKLYCLRLLDESAARAEGAFRILDLGCGDGRNFVRLLRTRPNVRYVGVEPSRSAAEAARRMLPGAEIVNASAYGIRLNPSHAVVSFSVLEHVADRGRYFAAVRANLAPGGRVYLNYDTGHFVADADLTERAKAFAGRLLARVGNESRYRAPVRAEEFARLVEDAGLRIVDDKAFNTDLKRLYPIVPDGSRDVFMERWLGVELGLNRLGFRWRDELAFVFRTRNIVLEPLS